MATGAWSRYFNMERVTFSNIRLRVCAGVPANSGGDMRRLWMRVAALFIRNGIL